MAALRASVSRLFLEVQKCLNLGPMPDLSENICAVMKSLDERNIYKTFSLVNQQIKGEMFAEHIFKFDPFNKHLKMLARKQKHEHLSVCSVLFSGLCLGVQIWSEKEH